VNSRLYITTNVDSMAVNFNLLGGQLLSILAYLIWMEGCVSARLHRYIKFPKMFHFTRARGFGHVTKMSSWTIPSQAGG